MSADIKERFVSTGEDLTPYLDTINEQNERFNKATEIRDRDFRTLARQGVTDEQVDTLEELLTKAADIPYEEIADRSSKVFDRLRSLDQEEANASLLIDKDVIQIQDLAKLAITLAPRRETEIERMRQEKIDQARNEVLEILQIDRTRALTACDLADKEFDQYGKAWPLPMAMRSDDVNVLYELINSTEVGNSVVVTEDIIPVTPAVRAHQAEVVERVMRTVDNPDASTYLQAYLAEFSEQVVTVEDLIRFIYSIEGAGDDPDYRSRVTTLLGPKVQGKRNQQDLFEKYGLSLQYGWRLLKKVEYGDGGRILNSSIIRRTRIYRTHKPGNPIASGESEVARVNQGVVFDMWEEPADIVNQTSIEVESSTEEPVEVTVDRLQVVQDAYISAETAEYTWEDVFVKDVRDAIDSLVETNLFSEDVISGGHIRFVSASRSLATKRSYELLKHAGFLNREQFNHDEMNRCQRVIALLFNAHQDILSDRKGGKRKQAVQIIENEIAARLNA